jgi:acetyl-CoA carboxylase biotin carboxyl carrier protein
MFKLSEIKDLIKLVDETSIQELEIENEGTRLAIRKPNKTESILVNSVPAQQHIAAVNAAPQQAQAPADTAKQAAVETKAGQETANLHKIASPMVGTFYAAPAPDKPEYVKKGDKVKPDTVVCIVEAMKLMNEIEAEVKGEIVEVLVDSGQLVEFGQPLYLVKPE